MERGTLVSIALFSLSAIFALSPLIYPILTLWLLLVATILAISAGIALIRKKPTNESKWQRLTKVDLLLDRESKETSTFILNEGDSIRVVVTGTKRFIVHLATNITKSRYDSEKNSPETRNFDEVWNIENEGKYAIMVEPVGASPFWVTVKVYLEK